MLCVASWNANGVDEVNSKMLVAVLTDQSAELVDVLALTETGGMHNAQMQHTGFYTTEHLQAKRVVG